MAITLEIGVCDLLPEFLADALVFLATLQTAGAVTAGALQALFDHLNHFLIFVQPYSHWDHILSEVHYKRSCRFVKEGEMAGNLEFGVDKHVLLC